MALSPYIPLANTGSGAKRNGFILYVEDEDINWELTEVSFRGRYNLHRAKSSREAFELLAKNTYDLILMDIQLSASDLNGIEITQVLRGRYEGQLPHYATRVAATTVPIIFVTAYTARYTKDELIAAGGVDMIPKPVDFVKLSLTITRLILRDAATHQPDL